MAVDASALEGRGERGSTGIRGRDPKRVLSYTRRPMSEADAVSVHERGTQARCIAVRIGPALYGLPVAHVQEVIGARTVTRVFHAPSALAGVTNLRGEVLPVLELS